MATISIYEAPTPSSSSLSSWRQVNWVSNDLPTVRFRIGLPGGNAEYRPEAISATNLTTRQRVLSMLRTSEDPLWVNLQDIIQRTRSAGGIEHSAYILANGSFAGRQSGSGFHAPVGQRPSGSIVGFLHTHPVSAQNLAPPSANDFCLPFGNLPIQLVAEMGGRIWELFEYGYSSLLGTFDSNSLFTPLTNTVSAGLVYRVVSTDQLRMEAYEEENRRQQDRATEFQRRMREIRQPQNPNTTLH